MLYYLDSVIVIYAVDGAPADQLRALTRLEALEESGHQFAISDLTRAECLVPAFGANAGDRLFRFFEFFHSKNLRTVALTSAMYARAAAVRGCESYSALAQTVGSRRYSLADALHLTAAVESGCDVFLTNDRRLTGFLHIAVEELS